jgi:hypothetical protein
MPQIRVFNPSSYTPRSYFADIGGERRTTKMAKHHRRHHYHRRRRNPFGVTGGLVKDAGYNAAGALGSLWLATFLGQSGWLDVAATAGAGIALAFAGKFVGGESAREELLKGGLTATIIKALHQAGMFKNLGLGLYAASYFPVPTGSDAYGRTAIPWPVAPALPAAGMSGLGAGRFRSRYVGRF